MKKFIFPAILLVAFFSSCQKDLLQTPETTKTANGFYANEAEIEEGINAVYAALQFTGNYDTSPTSNAG